MEGWGIIEITHTMLRSMVVMLIMGDDSRSDWS